MKKRLQIYAASALAMYALLCFGMYMLQRRFIYHPPAWSHDDSQTVRTSRAERVALTAADGQASFGLLVPPTGPAVADSARIRVWLYLGGNAQPVESSVFSADAVRRAGLPLFVGVYRGYSGNSGSPTEAGLIADARAAWRWLREVKGLPASAIAVHGKSLGGGVAVGLVSGLVEEGEVPGALVVETSFTSVAARGQELYPFLPVRWLLSDSFDNEGRLARIAASAPALPVVVCGATLDSVLPFAMSRRLFELCGPRGLFLELEADHDRLFFDDPVMAGRALAWIAAGGQASGTSTPEPRSGSAAPAPDEAGK